MFTTNLKTQVEIFVNRMKSNSSRGRSISTDSSVQNLFLNLTAFHSRLLEYIKKADDKRMWFEQLQDKLTQIKDSRAALDVLRQEHQEKLRQQAEEQERQRQLQMAYKLDLMRKKKQEYLQYQRQLALQRIQEQEREMKMHQDQQKVMYSMGVPSYPGQFMPQPIPNPQQSKNESSPAHIMPQQSNINNYNPNMPMNPSNNFPPHPGAMVPRYPMSNQPNIYSNVANQQPQMVAPGIHPNIPQQYANPNPLPATVHISQQQNNVVSPPNRNNVLPTNQIHSVVQQVPTQPEHQYQTQPQHQPPAPTSASIEDKVPTQDAVQPAVAEAELISFD